VKERIFEYLQGDRIIWIIALILGLVSILAVYSSISSLAYKYQEGNTFYFLLKHLIMMVAGFGIMYGVHRMPHRYIYRISQLMIWVSAGLLLFTLLFGSNINAASRWLTIPIINQSFQTSDLAKIVLIAYVARLLSRKNDSIKDFKTGVLPVLLPIVIICALILPANFSTAFLLFCTCLILMFIAGTRVIHIAAIVGGGALFFALILAASSAMPELLPRANTWKSRILSYSETEESAGTESQLQRNYQVEMAKIAIHRGGLLPNGPGKGTSRNYMPHPYSDMIYAFIVEEYGSLLGGLGLLSLYIILLFRVIRISSRSQKKFSTYLALGLGLLLVLQALSNMAVAVNLVPVTGQPLPFVSMGGTSLWFTCISLGIILSISREQGMDKSKKRTLTANSFA
jgi:cell division protein FtsW